MARTLAHILVGLGLLVAGMVTTPVAHAQMTPERLERELDRNDELLARAAEVVARAISERPRQVLDIARNLQHDAREAFHGHHYVLATGKMRLARETTGRAVELATAELRLLDQVRHLIAENHDLSARARGVVSASGNPEAARLLDAGLELLQRGQRAFHDHEFRAAVRLSLFGRDLVLRAMRTVEGDAGLDESRVRDEIQRTADFLREAAGADGPASARRFDEAGRLQARAEQELRGKRLAQARRLTLRARELVLDVLRDESQAPDASDVHTHIARVEARYERVAEALGRGKGRERRLLTEARNHLDAAQSAAAGDDPRRALAEAQLANSLLDQIESR